MPGVPPRQRTGVGAQQGTATPRQFDNIDLYQTKTIRDFRDSVPGHSTIPRSGTYVYALSQTPSGFTLAMIGAMGACVRLIARKRSDFVMRINAAIRFF